MEVADLAATLTRVAMGWPLEATAFFVNGVGRHQWGGTTAAGLDCSGFVQQVYRLDGVSLDRDACG